jgi:hypothetical protein
VVVGVTNEAEGLVTKWIADKKAKYPLVIVQGNQADEAYGVEGFPHSAMVDPKGSIIWMGHPASLPHAKMESALAGAYFIPALPSKYGSINDSVKKKEYGKAHAALVKELAKGDNPELAKAKDAIEKLGATRTATADSQGKAGDYAAAVGILDDVAKQWKGLDVADEAAKTAKTWRADKSIKAQIKGGEDFKKAEALEKTNDPAAKKKAFQMYKDIAKDCEGTPIGDKAKAAAEKLKSSS